MKNLCIHVCTQALTPEEQSAKILRWADIEEEAKLDAALAGLSTEVKKQVSDLRITMQVLKIQKVGRDRESSGLFTC